MMLSSGLTSFLQFLSHSGREERSALSSEYSTWLRSFPWLVFSVSNIRGLGWDYSLFAPRKTGRGEGTTYSTLVTDPLTKYMYKKAIKYMHIYKFYILCKFIHYTKSNYKYFSIFLISENFIKTQHAKNYKEKAEHFIRDIEGTHVDRLQAGWSTQQKSCGKSEKLILTIKCLRPFPNFRNIRGDRILHKPLNEGEVQ